MREIPDDSDDSAGTGLRLFDSVMLLTVLSTATDVRDAINRRRSGRDPRAQEDLSYARDRVFDALDRLDDAFMRLFVHRVSGSGPILSVDRMLLLRRMGRELHLVHQRLLSLYPAVSADCIEEVRYLERCCRTSSGEAPAACGDEAHDLVDRGFAALELLRKELSDGP